LVGGGEKEKPCEKEKWIPRGKRNESRFRTEKERIPRGGGRKLRDYLKTEQTHLVQKSGGKEGATGRKNLRKKSVDP